MDFKENQNIGTMEVLERHQFDKKALTDFMEKNVQDFVGPLSIEEFKGGQSNPTYLVKTKTQSYNIIIGNNLIKNLSKILKDNSMNFKKCLLVIDKKVPKKNLQYPTTSASMD